MRIAREDLQQVAGTRLRRVVGTMTGNRFKGAALGAGVTVLMQSSSATTVLQLAHIGRLNEGTAETIDTSDIHIDVVSDLSRISAHARTLAQVVWVDLR